MEIVAFIKSVIGKEGLQTREWDEIGEKSGEEGIFLRWNGRPIERSDAGQWLAPTQDSPTREERVARVYDDNRRTLLLRSRMCVETKKFETRDRRFLRRVVERYRINRTWRNEIEVSLKLKLARKIFTFLRNCASRVGPGIFSPFIKKI